MCQIYIFLATNNVVEYKALLTGLELAKRIRVRHLVLHVDSQLGAKRVTGEYEAKDPFLFSYRQEVQARLSGFDTVEVRKIHRE